jgi:hypothetical protein
VRNGPPGDVARIFISSACSRKTPKMAAKIDFDFEKIKVSNDEVSAYSAAKMLRELAVCDTMELKQNILLGRYVPIDDIERIVASGDTVIRTLMLSLPDRVAVQIAVMDDPVVIEEFLYQEINNILEELSTKRFASPPSVGARYAAS